MRGSPLLIAAVLLAAVAVQGVPGVGQYVQTTSTAMTPVVTLAAGAAGTTTLGASATKAVTNDVALPGTGSVEVLKVLHGTADWTVELVGLGVTGAAAGDSVTLKMVGSTTQTQVILSGTTITQAVGTPVSIPAAGPDVQITAQGTCAGTCYFGLWVAIRPPGLATPVMAYLYELYVT